MDRELTIELDSDMVLAVDAAPLMAFDRANRSTDVDGHMHVETTNISKANVCPYLGSEIPNGDELGLDPSRVYMLYRDAAELEASAKTYENKPLMMQHIAVSSDTPHKHFIVGCVSNVRFRYPYLVASLSVWDSEAIAAIESGAQKELSCGYRYTCDMSPGEINGVKYDGVMRGIVANHVALVETGRAGPDVLVSDELPQGFNFMKKSALIAALSGFFAADADLIAVDAAITALAVDAKKGKDCADPEMKDKAEAQDESAVEETVKDEAPAKGEKDDTDANDEMDDMDAEDESDPKMKPKMSGDKKGMDSATAQSLVKAALAERDALHSARREVESIVGVVGFDTAAEVYGAALTKLGVDTAGVDASAFPAMLKMATKVAPAPIALDAAAPKNSELAAAYPGAARYFKS